MSYHPSLDYFLEIADSANISQAAEKLHITQQSLSIYLKRLEHYYGVKLVERRPVFQLTKEGETLLTAAKEISLIYNKLDQTFHSTAQQPVIRLGCIRSHSSELLSRLPLLAFHQKYPDISIEIVEEHSPILEKKLLADELDFYLGNISEETGKNSQLETTPLCEYPLMVMVTDSLLRQYMKTDTNQKILEWQKGIRLEELKELPMIAFPSHSRIRRLVDSYGKEKSIPFQIVCESMNTTINRRMCLQNAGFTLVPFGEEPVDNAFLFPILEPRLYQPVLCVRKRSRILTSFQKDFLNTILALSDFS